VAYDYDFNELLRAICDFALNQLQTILISDQY